MQRHERDIQFLGLGTNGHIGANEPGTPFDSKLFIADSCISTMEATKKLFQLKDSEVPSQMYTMGFQEIMAAKCVILAASGISKAEAVKKWWRVILAKLFRLPSLRNTEILFL